MSCFVKCFKSKSLGRRRQYSVYVQRHAPLVVEISCLYTQVAPVVAQQFLSCFVLFAGSVASETSEAAVTEPDGKLQCLLLLSAMYTKHHTLDSWWLTYNAHHIEVTI